MSPMRSRPRRLLRDRLRAESGQALVIAMVTMLIVSLLAASAVTLAVSTDKGAQQNVTQKDATEAAEAGLQAALYRYNTLAPGSGSCVGDTVTTPSSNGTCASSVITAGNGSTYQYFTTPASTSGTCVGGTVTNSTAGVANVCITAIGTSNGVSVRSEIRAASYQGGSLFQYNGITALQGISSTNGTYSINAPEATNGVISVSANATLNSEPNYKLYLGPNGSYQNQGWGSANPTTTTLSSPIILPPVNPGTSATTSENSACTSTPNGTGGCGITSPDTQYYAPVTYNPTTRSLTTSGYPTITLAGGVYNFCSFNSSGGLTVNIATGAKVVIYIDSPSDPGSGCPAGSGSLNLGSGSTNFNNPSDDPTALQIYVYSQNTINLSQSLNFYGTLYAPTSTVAFSNGSWTFDGAVAANLVTFNNGGTFNSDPLVSSIQGGTTQGTYYRTAYGQCTAAASSTAPTAGCS